MFGAHRILSVSYYFIGPMNLSLIIIFFFTGHSEVVQLLLYSGFDPKQKDRFGQVK